MIMLYLFFDITIIKNEELIAFVCSVEYNKDVKN